MSTRPRRLSKVPTGSRAVYQLDLVGSGLQKDLPCGPGPDSGQERGSTHGRQLRSAQYQTKSRKKEDKKNQEGKGDQEDYNVQELWRDRSQQKDL